MTSGFDQLGRELTAAERRLANGRAQPGRLRGLLLGLATTAVVAAVVAAVLLTGTTGRDHAYQRRRRPPGRPGTARCREAPSLSPARSASARSRRRATLRIVRGVIALPASPGERRALQTGRTSSGWLFAKWGLWVRGGARVQLIVPTPLRHRLTITWGNAGEGNHGARMVDRGCSAGHARWLNFAGGYWVRRPMCATLIVETGRGGGPKVRIGIGTPCPGQLPPLPPTQR